MNAYDVTVCRIRLGTGERREMLHGGGILSRCVLEILGIFTTRSDAAICAIRHTNSIQPHFGPLAPTSSMRSDLKNVCVDKNNPDACTGKRDQTPSVTYCTALYKNFQVVDTCAKFLSNPNGPLG